jgi:hypothetical protein
MLMSSPSGLPASSTGGVVGHDAIPVMGYSQCFKFFEECNARSEGFDADEFPRWVPPCRGGVVRHDVLLVMGYSPRLKFFKECTAES